MVIYQITNLGNNKKYIGQTTQQPAVRWSQHKSTLKKNKCNNIYLQRAWNKYGENNFVFEMLEVCSTLSELNDKEWAYIQKYNTNNISEGYNIRAGGNSGGAMSSATKQKLSTIRMGKSPSNKGMKYGPQSLELRQQKSIKQRKNFVAYPTIISPDGIEYTIDTVKGFCKEHNLYHRRLFGVLSGEVIQHRGWYIKGTDSHRAKQLENRNAWRNNKIVRRIMSPAGIIYEFSHLTNFCKSHGLSAGKVSELFSDKRKKHKNWLSMK